MATIVPTVTAENAHIYREQIERVEAFAERIHIDLMDGKFTPNTSLPAESVWWPEATEIDVHVMFQNPEEVLDVLIDLRPSLIIVPAECSADLRGIAHKLEEVGIRAGLALLPEITVESVETLLADFQHVLIFSGNLGHQGGSYADLSLLEKAGQAKAVNPDIEIGWDGGVNESNAEKLVSGGVEVLNAGGFIQKSPTPEAAYRQLVDQI